MYDLSIYFTVTDHVEPPIQLVNCRQIENCLRLDTHKKIEIYFVHIATEWARCSRNCEKIQTLFGL